MSGVGGSNDDDRLGPGTLIWLVLVSAVILIGVGVFLVQTLS